MIFFIKNSACVGHARVQKFINFFENKGFKTKNIIWSRDSKSEPNDLVILKGGGYGGARLAFKYVIWVTKLTMFLMTVKTKNKDHTFFAIDFDAAIACYLASRFRAEIKYIYDIHDEFAIRYKFPSFLKWLIKQIDQVVRKNALITVHVDHSRVGIEDTNYTVIQNITTDLSPTLNKRLKTSERTFVVSGLLCAQRGLEALYRFAVHHPECSFIAAGNITDHVAEKFIDCCNVDYRGYIPQHELLRVSANATGVFSLYDPSVEINRLAASNKLYDAMMLGIPVITNRGIAASDFVNTHQIGFVVPFDYCSDWETLASMDLTKLENSGKNGRKLYESEFCGSGSFEGRSIPLLKVLRATG